MLLCAREQVQGKEKKGHRRRSRMLQIYRRSKELEKEYSERELLQRVLKADAEFLGRKQRYSWRRDTKACGKVWERRTLRIT